nr:uncharacterized protein LOC109180384 isoform X3 [Ipomoea batatas]GMD99897.1 uncharacterized protein LOC109180384 isoform X3 [Ipomoea batatas]
MTSAMVPAGILFVLVCLFLCFSIWKYVPSCIGNFCTY